MAASTPPAQYGADQQPTPQGSQRWYKMDLHTHTPASGDYEEPQISYLDWLRVAADRGLDIVAITDHNTVAGVAAIRREIEWLTRLEQQNRLNDEERASLAAWRELSNKVLVLPGFEFTATFGFHILGIFPPETSVRTLEHILLSLRVPPEKIDIGSTETGSSTDVLNAYRVIREAGGLAIAAHANSTHGVAMRSFPFGGQTKIAYTQDVNLDALEVTDLEHRGYSTARFFDGSKTEYSRRMHSIQGSDAHRLTMDPRNPKRLGIGERATEVFLEDSTFEALARLLRSTAWGHTRPARPKERPFDELAVARAAGPSAVQSFHESATKANGRLDAILADICAFANTAGGAVYVGVSLKRDGPIGLTRPNQVEQQVIDAVSERIAPSLVVRPEIVKSDNANVLRLHVPKGDDRPHALDGVQIWVREESRTRAALRDEIVAMVLDLMEQQGVEDDAALDAALDEGQIVADVEALPAATTVVQSTVLAESTTKPKARRTRRGGKSAAARKLAAANAAAAPEEVRLDGSAEVSAPALASQSEEQVDERQPGSGLNGIAAESKAIEVASAASDQSELAHADGDGALVQSLAEEAAAPPPKPKRTRKKKADPADANAAVSPETSVASPGEEPDEPLAAVAKPRATRAKAAGTAKSPTKKADAKATTKKAASSKPTAKSTAATAQAVAVADATAASDAMAEAPAAKPAPRKRVTKAKATAATPAPAVLVLPKIGVEIVESELKGAVWHHTIRDLRNDSLVKGVTRRGARDLWNYAIRAHEEKRFNVANAEWRGNAGLLHVEKRAGKMRYDLVLRDPEGARIFYGATEEAMPGPWAVFVVDGIEEE